MYIFAYICLLLAMLCALGGSGLAAAKLWQGESDGLAVSEYAALAVAALLTVVSAVLLYALAACDFSLGYVASYTDRTLPLFYRLTAFWAGQEGSLLFWALMVALCGATFRFTAAYRALSEETRQWFWLFFLAIMAFFGLLLATWSNPLTLRIPVPADGRGLNPLLQNPGMIIHPPLLFLGYGGFVIPGCLALAQAMRRAADRRSGLAIAEPSWAVTARPFTLTAWMFLTSGIVIGAWWAYMELGWGGYWAWDPVENASLIPWLVGTAALHAGLLETRRNALHRAHIFLMALTTVSAFFATYLVRGNVVQSVHAFGEGGVGAALLLFVLAGLALSAAVAALGKAPDARPLPGLETREGFVVMTIWLLLAVALIILTATLWPVISSLWSARSEGLTAAFYNGACLPLFVALLALLAACPWLSWGGGVRSWRALLGVFAALAVLLGLFWTFGIKGSMPLIGAALCGTVLVSLLLQAVLGKGLLVPASRAALAVHLGLGLLALGIAFSGPGKTELEVELAKGQTAEVGAFSVTLNELYEGRGDAGAYTFLEAELTLRHNGADAGTVAPQRRVYAKFGQAAYAEAATRFSFGDEFYASLLGLDSEQRAVLRLSSHPLVNWIWIGGALMTLGPLLAFGARRKKNGSAA